MGNDQAFLARHRRNLEIEDRAEGLPPAGTVAVCRGKKRWSGQSGLEEE